MTCLIRQTWNRITENVFDGSTLVMADLITRVKQQSHFPCLIFWCGLQPPLQNSQMSSKNRHDIKFINTLYYHQWQMSHCADCTNDGFFVNRMQKTRLGYSHISPIPTHWACLFPNLSTSVLTRRSIVKPPKTMTKRGTAACKLTTYVVVRCNSISWFSRYEHK